MESVVKTDLPEKLDVITSPATNVSQEQKQQQQLPQNAQQQQQPQQKTKRKHRRGKPKSKNANKPYKKSNWKFQVPRPNYNCGGPPGGGGGGGGVMNHQRQTARAKLVRSRSLVPYNTNKFLMEEHLAEVPSALLTPSGRTRDSSFSVDSEDNYFFSLPEDEEEFLTKEFANVYEKARVERLENLTKEQLIEECLQIEDRYSSDQGRQQQLNTQRITAEFMSKIRVLEEKVKELSRENYNLRCQLMRSAAMAAAAAAAASPPSAAPPTGAVCEPTPMDSSSMDSESDSSTSSSSSSNDSGAEEANVQDVLAHARRRRSSSTRSSFSDNNAFDHLDCLQEQDADVEGDDGDNEYEDGIMVNRIALRGGIDYARHQLLEPGEYGANGSEMYVNNVAASDAQSPVSSPAEAASMDHSSAGVAGPN